MTGGKLNMQETQYKYLYISSFAVAAVIAYMSFVSAQQKDPIYYFGLLLSVPFILLGIYFRHKSKVCSMIAYIEAVWSKPEDKKRNFKEIKALYTLIKNDSKSQINDQTWEDLTMDKIFAMMDKCFTTPGEHMLYNMLRTPLMETEALKARKVLINFFIENEDLRKQIQLNLALLGKENKSGILSILWNEIKVNNYINIMVRFMSYMPIISILLIIPAGIKAVPLLILCFGFNLMIHLKFGTNISADSNSIRYLGSIIRSAQKICKINDNTIKEHFPSLERTSSACSKIAKKTSNVDHIEGVDVLFDYLNILFLIQEKNFFSVSQDIKILRKELQELYLCLGELDAVISMASYINSSETITEPELINNGRFIEACELIHPLIKDAVPNSISINSRGIILTGSNMSGKSTFLRTLGTNALLAQTLGFCHAKTYKGSFFKIISSISPSDNILDGKSYYLGEAEAILNIINTCEDNIPVLSIIDEIFRGTNPTERISASAEILTFLINHNALSIAATHDLKLTTLLKDNYDSYYFTEDVDNDGLKFDYIIKKGVSPTKNAIKLLKYLGYPEEIIEKSYDRIETL